MPTFGRAGWQTFLSLQFFTHTQETIAKCGFPSYHPVYNFSFLGKIIEQVIAQQLQVHLNATGFQALSQSHFHPSDSIESMFMALVDNLCLDIKGEVAPC